ncbi:MAG: monovalent cation/H(+) antiporter subunit G [Acidobacteria bacterium]|nr:monovalent cation/H(+) antiporter subunit G [Acidobacteriota bacterium]
MAAFLLLSGAGFALLAALGLWRFDDLFSRIHAATKAITLGMLLVVAAAALRMETSGDVLKLVLAALLQVISAPVAGHMLGRASYAAGTKLTPHMLMDHLDEDGVGKAEG